MTWPFENDTSAITKKLATKSLQSEKRRNLMVVIAVALAAFLICFTGIVSTSLTQMQRNPVSYTHLNWAPEECPVCAEGKLPLVKPGSRKMALK